MKIKMVLDNGAIPPTRAHMDDAGVDLYAPIPFVVEAGQRAFINTGVHVAIPPRYFGSMRSKSGLLRKFGILTTGVIDSGYRGPVGVTLINTTHANIHFERGDKIAQMIIQPYETADFELVEELDETDRGSNGFGSSGR